MPACVRRGGFRRDDAGDGQADRKRVNDLLALEFGKA
jgi:hypothetical protein